MKEKELFLTKGWGGRIRQENTRRCLSSSSLKITLSPLSLLQDAFDVNTGISRLSSGIAAAAHGTNRVNKTHTHMRVHAPHTPYTPHTYFFQAKLQTAFSTLASIFSEVIKAPTLSKGQQSPLKGSPTYSLGPQVSNTPDSKAGSVSLLNNVEHSVY